MPRRKHEQKRLTNADKKLYNMLISLPTAELMDYCSELAEGDMLTAALCDRLTVMEMRLKAARDTLDQARRLLDNA